MIDDKWQNPPLFYIIMLKNNHFKNIPNIHALLHFGEFFSMMRNLSEMHMLVWSFSGQKWEDISTQSWKFEYKHVNIFNCQHYVNSPPPHFALFKKSIDLKMMWALFNFDIDRIYQCKWQISCIFPCFWLLWRSLKS